MAQSTESMSEEFESARKLSELHRRVGGLYHYAAVQFQAGNRVVGEAYVKRARELIDTTFAVKHVHAEGS